MEAFKSAKFCSSALMHCHHKIVRKLLESAEDNPNDMQNEARIWVILKELLLLINMCFEFSHSIICSNLSKSKNLYSCIQYLNDIKLFSILFFKWHWLVETLSRCFKTLGILGIDLSQETICHISLKIDHICPSTLNS